MMEDYDATRKQDSLNMPSFEEDDDILSATGAANDNHNSVLFLPSDTGGLNHLPTSSSLSALSLLVPRFTSKSEFDDY